MLAVRRELARDRGAGRRVVDVDRAFAHAGEDAVVSERHGAEVVVVADAGEDELGALGRLARRLGPPAAVLGHPFLRLAGAAVVDGEVVPALLRDVAGHRISHHAKPDEGDLRHCRLRLFS